VRQRIIKGKEVCAMKEKPLDINQLMLLIRTMQDKASWLLATHRDRIENGPTRKTIVSYMDMEFARLHWKTRNRDEQCRILAERLGVSVSSLEVRSSNIFRYMEGKAGVRPETAEVKDAVELLGELRFTG
jgi:hypothetical protein